MKLTLTPKDWELLSAYLDGQLTEPEKSHMQALLAQRPDLGQGLDDLRRTRAVLRAVPMRRAPRNFTLTPAMVHKSQRRFNLSWAPAFGFASALATILFVLSFFFRLTPLATSTAFAPAAQAPQYSQRAGANQAAPPIIQWNDTSQGPATGMGGAPAGLGAADGSAVPNAASGVQATAAPDIAPQPSPTQSTPMGLLNPQTAPETSVAPTAAAKAAGSLQAPTATAGGPALAAPLAASAPTTSPAAALENGPILGVAPAEEQGKIIVPTQEASDLYAYASSQPVSNWPWVQVGLAAVALAFGTSAFLMWRRSRH
jgi:hypothetical protein